MKVGLHARDRHILLLVSLFALAFCSTGCRSFLRDHALKAYPVNSKPVTGLKSPTSYQADFLYLKTLGETVFPLEDRYFPPGKRAAMEKESLERLGRPECGYETFLWSIETYLGGFNNAHALVLDNARPSSFTNLYPFKVHYVGTKLHVLDVGGDCEGSLIGQRITAVNDQPIAEVEYELLRFARGENLWKKKTSLEPFGYSRPDFYRLAGLVSSASNNVKLEFEGHPSVGFAPTRKDKVQWQGSPHPPHPITTRRPHLYDCQLFPEQNLAYLQFNACFDKTALLSGLNMVNPWARPLVRAWLGFEFHQKKPNAVLNGIYDADRPVFEDYLASSIRAINQQDITNLILDLRHNGGGEFELVYQLLYHLTKREDLINFKIFKFNPEMSAYYDPEEAKRFRSWYKKKFGVEPPSGQLLPAPVQERPFFARITNSKSPYYISPERPVFKGNIIVLANQNTGSAAALLAGLIQDNRLAVVVGTTTGNNLTGPLTLGTFRLPHSGLMVGLPTEYFERAVPTNGAVFHPDYWVEDTLSEVQSGHDAAFEKALELFDSGGGKMETLKDLEGAWKVLQDLKKKGLLPGWHKEDHGTFFDQEVKLNSIIFHLRKHGSPCLYHFTVTRPLKSSEWRLERDWR